MKNKKRTIVLALAGLLSAGALTGVAVESFGGGLANVFAADNEDSYIWNHYTAVAPTATHHGSKEFWANCSVLHQFSLTKPLKGIIQNQNLDFTQTPWFDELEPKDERYIAPAEQAVIETLTKDNVTFGDTTEFFAFSSAFDKFGWLNSAIYQSLKAEKIAEFGGQSRENDGIFIFTQAKDIEAYSTPSITLPKINFQNLLRNGGKVAMEFGCYTNDGFVKFRNKEIFNNFGKGSHIYGLTRVKAYFYKEGESVKVSFIVSTRDTTKNVTHTEEQVIGGNKTTVTVVDREVYSFYKVAEITESLTEAEANGSTGISFGLGTNKYERIYWMSNLSTVKDTKFKEPAVTSRPKDSYYNNYTFAGWYVDGKEYNANNTSITKDSVFSPRWVVGKESASYLTDIKWEKTDFVVGVDDPKVDPKQSNAEICNIEGALAGLTWSYRDDTDRVNKYKQEFYDSCYGQDISDDTGMFMRANGLTSFIELPKINFLEKIPTGKKMFMKLGCIQDNNKLDFNVNDGSTSTTKSIIRTTRSESGNALLTKVLVSFYKDASNKVHMTCDDTTVDLFNQDGENRIWETVLTDNQANGTDGLKLIHGQGGARYYWIGRPFIYQDNDVALDVLSGSGITVQDGIKNTRSETFNDITGKAPYGQWYRDIPTIADETAGIGILGNNHNAAAKITFKATNFKAMFDKQQGVKFNIGVWNGTDSIYLKNGETYMDLGSSYVKPNISDKQQYFDTSLYTRQIVNETWHNWQFTVDQYLGLTVYNQHTKSIYSFALTDDQLNGAESISVKLTNSNANGHFFYVSNMTTYQY